MSFVGFLVSIDCGDVLGTYQGQVESVEPQTQSITIVKAYRNAIQCKVQRLTINASDIRDLKILGNGSKEGNVECSKSMDSRNENTKACKPNKPKKEERNPITAGDSRVSNCKVNNLPGRSSSEERKKSRCYVQLNTKRMSPSYNNKQTDPGHSNGVPSNKGQGGSNRSTPNEFEYEEVHYNRNQATDSRKKPVNHSTPRKIENQRRRTPREDCFSAPVESILDEDEFDFEKNLAMFDKQAVFDEIENTGYPGMVVRAQERGREAQFKNDENVLQSKPTVYNQIRVHNGGSGTNNKEYVTDSGLVVPSISYEARCKLITLAEQYGLSTERQIEMVGRSAAEMVLQLLGGSNRLNPQNAHQRPSVVLLCGPHMQGAQGVNCARHLSAHGVNTTTFLPNFVKVMQELDTEVKLYEQTEGQRISSIKDLPSTPVDMIISALNSHENQLLQDQSWFKSLVTWSNQNKAPVVAIDPPVGDSGINTKWSLGVAMPLALSDTCGQVYLCDLSLPNKIYQEIHITYRSPFGHKFVIPLHDHS